MVLKAYRGHVRRLRCEADGRYGIHVGPLNCRAAAYAALDPYRNAAVATVRSSGGASDASWL